MLKVCWNAQSKSENNGHAHVPGVKNIVNKRRHRKVPLPERVHLATAEGPDEIEEPIATVDWPTDNGDVVEPEESPVGSSRKSRHGKSRSADHLSHDVQEILPEDATDQETEETTSAVKDSQLKEILASFGLNMVDIGAVTGADVLRAAGSVLYKLDSAPLLSLDMTVNPMNDTLKMLAVRPAWFFFLQFGSFAISFDLKGGSDIGGAGVTEKFRTLARISNFVS
ncbi:hypothetical protein V5799_031696 [Amblyomma americanum]|uniref:Uncharacterized protein n=1 Tax=Amblyomma americanum TaxID=6943 RepID=A0AAQ4DTA2_AMBAM